VSEVFLVPLTQPEAAPRVLAAARRAAKAVDSVRIEVVAVRIPPETMVIPSDEAISAAHLEALTEQEEARVSKLKDAFDRWAAGGVSPAVSAGWTEIDGLPAEMVAARAQNADLVIIERPRRPVDQGQRQTTDAAIFGSHRPVLVIPPGDGPDRELGDFGHRLAIAWKDDGRAVKAVIPALRYFADADEISVLAGYRGAKASDELPAPLAERGIAASMHALAIGAEPFGRTLLDTAKALRADLLVMGAYAHSPLREMLLGGVTRYVLAHAEIPVLMRH
jgi:nucleotide-binding universal stress UspA family protein